MVTIKRFKHKHDAEQFSEENYRFGWSHPYRIMNTWYVIKLEDQ